MDELKRLIAEMQHIVDTPKHHEPDYVDLAQDVLERLKLINDILDHPTSFDAVLKGMKKNPFLYADTEGDNPYEISKNAWLACIDKIQQARRVHEAQQVERLEGLFDYRDGAYSQGWSEAIQQAIDIVKGEKHET